MNYAILSMLTGGVSLYLLALSIRSTNNTYFVTTIVYFISLVILLPFLNLRKINFKKLVDSNKFSILSGTFLGISTLLYLKSMETGLSIRSATVLFQSGFLVSILMNIFLSRENVHLKQVLGIFCAALSIIIIRSTL